MRLKKVLIINEGFSSNLGDQAINQSATALMQQLGFETHFLFFSNPSIAALPHYAYQNKNGASGSSAIFQIIPSGIKQWIIAAKYYLQMHKKISNALREKNYDYLLIGGGQLINSSNKTLVSFFAIAMYCWVKGFKKNCNGKVVLAAVGASGNYGRMEKYLYKKALQQADKIWVRDAFSATVLQQEFQQSCNEVPDIAFYTQQVPAGSNGRDTALLGIYGYAEIKEAFGNKYPTTESYYSEWQQKLVQYQAQGYLVKLFYTTQHDAAETRSFQQYLQQQGITVDIEPTNSLEALMAALSNAAIVYSARMHALILALQCGCRVELYPISQKLLSFGEKYLQQGKSMDAYRNELLQQFEHYFLHGLTPVE